jgi:serine/threonine protein kinase
VVQRNIKGLNLLLENNDVLKISEFGLVWFFDSNHKELMTSRVVTLWYHSPELLLCTTYYVVGVNLWSVDAYMLSCWKVVSGSDPIVVNPRCIILNSPIRYLVVVLNFQCVVFNSHIQYLDIL